MIIYFLLIFSFLCTQTEVLKSTEITKIQNSEILDDIESENYTWQSFTDLEEVLDKIQLSLYKYTPYALATIIIIAFGTIKLYDSSINSNINRKIFVPLLDESFYFYDF